VTEAEAQAQLLVQAAARAPAQAKADAEAQDPQLAQAQARDHVLIERLRNYTPTSDQRNFQLRTYSGSWGS
jgi:hypothetical protein